MSDLNQIYNEKRHVGSGSSYTRCSLTGYWVLGASPTLLQCLSAVDARSPLTPLLLAVLHRHYLKEKASSAANIASRLVSWGYQCPYPSHPIELQTPLSAVLRVVASYCRASKTLAAGCSPYVCSHPPPTPRGPSCIIACQRFRCSPHLMGPWCPHGSPSIIGLLTPCPLCIVGLPTPLLTVGQRVSASNTGEHEHYKGMFTCPWRCANESLGGGGLSASCM
jgi:hypothetical protein